MHRDLLHLRRELIRHDATRLATATLGPDALLLRYFPFDMGTKLLLVNFGADLRLDSIGAPAGGAAGRRRWKLHWSSEYPLYGGAGTPELDTPDGWRIPGEAAMMLVPVTT